MKRLCALLVLLTVLLTSGLAAASVEKFAVLIGNNKGDAGEPELRYAESDAQRLFDTLKDLGGVPPANMVFLHDEQSAVVVRTLVALNDRIRALVSSPDNQVVLFVYYSGHADAAALHLSGSHLDLAQLEQLVRGSAATFRVLVSDACRSGALTRVKGGAAAPPFALSSDDRLAGEGVVFLTASSASEDAQESDELKGSFFTHHFTSGLLGAADSDGDGRITLEEAYRYAHESTVRATSRTFSGIQHPTFRYELRGQGKIVLTELRAAAGVRPTLLFPEGRTYLVMQGSQSGAVVGEVSAVSPSRRLSVRPGRYFVRGRAKDFLLEGEVDAASGELQVADDKMRKVAFARLVRKGGSDVTMVHGPIAGYTMRTPLGNASTLCHGAYAGYAFAFEKVSVTPRLLGCDSGFSNATLRADVLELGADVRVAHAWDLPVVTVDVGVSAGVSVFRQSFETAGVAEPRSSGAGNLGASVGLSLDLGSGFYAATSGTVQTYLLRLEDSRGESSWRPNVAFRLDAGLGKHW